MNRLEDDSTPMDHLRGLFEERAKDLSKKKILIKGEGNRYRNDLVSMASIIVSNHSSLNKVLQYINNDVIKIRELPYGHQYKELLLTSKGEADGLTKSFRILQALNALKERIKLYNEEIDEKINRLYTSIRKP